MCKCIFVFNNFNDIETVQAVGILSKERQEYTEDSFSIWSGVHGIEHGKS